VTDQLPGILHQRRPAVVVADPAQHAGLACCPFNGSRFATIAANRFLAEDVFPRGGGCLNDFQMQMVGRGDTHHLNFGMADHLLPVGRGVLEAEAFLSLPCAVLHIVRTDYQSRPDAILVKAIRDQTVRTAVDNAHPPHADHANAHGVHHVPEPYVSRSARAEAAPARTRPCPSLPKRMASVKEGGVGVMAIRAFCLFAAVATPTIAACQFLVTGQVLITGGRLRRRSRESTGSLAAR